METISIIIKNDIQLADGYVYKSKSCYEGVSKYTDHKNRTCYEPVEGHVIIGSENVIELGFISSEVFRIIKNFDPEEIDKLKNKIKDMDEKIEILEKMVEKLEKKINTES